MTRRNNKAETEREIKHQWYMLPEDQRTRDHVEKFADDVWRAGLRLHTNSNWHYQLVRGLLGKY